MKKLIKFFIRQSCPRCFGMGVIETSDGGTRDCPLCKGKGMI